MGADKNDQLYALRHSAAHILATAVQKRWPKAQFGVGPVVENGFYYDIIVPGETISEDDLAGIEKDMQSVIESDYKFEQSDKSVEEAIEWSKEADQPFKEELLNDLKREGTTSAKDIDSEQLGLASDDSKVESVSFYTNGDFIDLCRGPHVDSTGGVKAFKLTKVAGAYWRGDETNPQMQRVYGVAFETQKELEAYLDQQEEAKARDHRKMGRELDLFTFSDMVGSGLPMYTPRGTWLRELLGRYTQQIRAKRGFERVWTPHITKPDLYKTSGHWDKFGDELFQVESQESSDSFAMKPMNCPHHTRIYASQPRSYKDLPIRYMENAVDYRDEKTGELHGLSRVRAMTQDDSHVFCTLDQIEKEAGELVQAAQEIYSTLDMELKFRLSFRDDSDAFLGDKKHWQEAQDQIKSIAESNNLDYYIEEGEAAFYGPKIDFMATDAIGREWQMATVQIDFVQPERFGLEYTDTDGGKKTPVMIHSALLGTIERFLSVYIEHTNGHFPFWLAPEQVRVVTVNDSTADYVSKITDQLDSLALQEPLKHNEIRYSLDERNDSLGKRIHEAEAMRVPVIMIVGPKDAEAKEVSLRVDGEESKVPLDKLSEFLTGL